MVNYWAITRSAKSKYLVTTGPFMSGISVCAMQTDNKWLNRV